MYSNEKLDIIKSKKIRNHKNERLKLAIFEKFEKIELAIFEKICVLQRKHELP
jgi:hypothetical protein